MQSLSGAHAKEPRASQREAHTHETITQLLTDKTLIVIVNFIYIINFTLTFILFNNMHSVRVVKEVEMFRSVLVVEREMTIESVEALENELILTTNLFTYYNNLTFH